ncbi:MAG: hypothetical protein ACI856_000401, partial [Kiritimatiellia bacterium]
GFDGVHAGFIHNKIKKKAPPQNLWVGNGVVLVTKRGRD